jgi:hypothetical protein
MIVVMTARLLVERARNCLVFELLAGSKAGAAVRSGVVSITTAVSMGLLPSDALAVNVSASAYVVVVGALMILLVNQTESTPGAEENLWMAIEMLATSFAARPREFVEDHNLPLGR